MCIWKVVPQIIFVLRARSFLLSTYSLCVSHSFHFLSFLKSKCFLLKFAEPTGKRFLLAVDVSGSMQCAVMGSRVVTACMASTAMAMVTGRWDSMYVCGMCVLCKTVVLVSCIRDGGQVRQSVSKPLASFLIYFTIFILMTPLFLFLDFSKNWEAEYHPWLLTQAGANQDRCSHNPRGCCCHSQQCE